MMFIAMEEGCTAELESAVNCHAEHCDVLYSEDQAEVADWAQARALQTKKSFLVFKLTEVLHYRGRK